MIPPIAADLRVYLAEGAGCAQVSDLASVVLWILDSVFSLEMLGPKLRREYRSWQDDNVCRLPMGGQLSTFDNDALTQLVIRCHDAGVRLAIEPLNNRLVRLVFSRRESTGNIHERHPSLEVAIARVRTHDYFGPTGPVRANEAFEVPA